MGSRNFIFKSPEAQFDLINNLVFANNSSINVYTNDEMKFLINSKKSIINNNLNIITLDDGINVSLYDKEKSILKANKIIWDINNSLMDIKGNIFLKNNQYLLRAGSALYKKSVGIIYFSNIKSYELYTLKNGANNTFLKVYADNAEVSIENKSLKFKSLDGKNVITNIYLN